MSDWRPVINQYLADFETQTTTALEEISEILLQSGQQFNARIKDYFLKIVQNRLEQTVEFFEIQYLSNAKKITVCDNDISAETNIQTDGNESGASSDVEEILEMKIKCETVSSSDEEHIMGEEDGVSTSQQPFSDAEPETIEPIYFNRNISRLSLDSNFSVGQRSIYSPSASNQPVVSPDVDHIKREPLIMNCEPFVKYVDVETTSDAEDGEHKLNAEYSQFSQTELRPVKRELSVESLDSASKKARHETTLKVSEENQVTSQVTDQMICDRRLKFICFYCQKPVEGRNIAVEPCETIEEITAHCNSAHDSKPLQYYAVGIASCFYCKQIDTYPKLQNHHNLKHRSQRFVVVDQKNRSKCGLCHKLFSNDEMLIHFKMEHNPLSLYGVFSPVCFIQREIERLIGINSYEAVQPSCKIKYFICGHCGVQIEAGISLQQHLEHDQFQFQCTNCEFKTHNQRELLNHEERIHHTCNARVKHATFFRTRLERHYFRTKLIFTNGLILFKHNLLNTSFDDRKEFWPFIDKCVEKIFGERTPFSTTEAMDSGKNKSGVPRHHEKQLEKQQEYRNNLWLSGISLVSKEELPNIFINICEAIGVHISTDDFESIFQRSGYDIIVKFKKWETKKKILINWSEKDENIEQLKSIRMGNDLTPFFRHLCKLAETAKQNNQIYSFWINERGLNVRRTVHSKVKIIWSKKSLSKYICES